MTRSVLCAVGLFFIGISLYGLFHSHGDLASFMDMSTGWTITRMLLGLGLIAYGLLDVIWQKAIRVLVGLGAVAALGITLLSFATLYILVIDTFCLIVTGIFGLTASLELQTTHPVRLPQVSLPKLSIPSVSWRFSANRRSIA